MNPDFIVFGAYTLSLFANYADWYTTVKGFEVGLKEANPLSFIQKLVKNPVAAGLVKVGLLPFVGVVIDLHGGKGIFNGIVGSLTAYTAIKNYLLLKKIPAKAK